MTATHEKAGAGVAAPYTGSDNNPKSQKENAVMTTVASPVKTAWHPSWCDPEECYLDSSGGIDHDYFHYSTSREVPYGREHKIQVQSLFMENLDGNPPDPQAPVEGRVYITDGSHFLDLSLEEAWDIADAIRDAANAASRTESATVAYEGKSTVRVVAEALEDSRPDVDARAVARDLVDKFGYFCSAETLERTVPAKGFWAIVDKHTPAVEERRSVAHYVGDAMKDWGPSWSVDYVDAITDDLTRQFGDDAVEHARVRSSAFWDTARRHVKEVADV